MLQIDDPCPQRYVVIRNRMDKNTTQGRSYGSGPQPVDRRGPEGCKRLLPNNLVVGYRKLLEGNYIIGVTYREYNLRIRWIVNGVIGFGPCLI